MGLRTVQQFLEGIKDGREVYYRGERVASVGDHLELGVAARHAAIDFEMAENPKYRDLAVVHEHGQEFSAFFRVPRGVEHLAQRSKLIEAGTTEGATLVILIKEIGTDALCAFRRVRARHKEEEGLARLKAFHQRCQDGDLAMAVAQTDGKGDRSKQIGRAHV